MRFRGILSAVLLLLGGSVGAGDKLAMKVSPAVAFAPANLVVRAYVTADRDNRSIEVVAESDEFYRSSEMQLDGENAPRTSVFEFRSLPPGTYQVSAVLLGAGGQRALVRSQVYVMVSGAVGDGH